MVQKRNAAYRLSTTVALVLAVLTVIEYFAAQSFNSVVLLMLLGVVKAYFVVNYFMHVSRLWKTEGEH